MILARFGEVLPLPSEREPEVVVVDDEPAILAAIRRALRHEPYRLVVLSSPHSALDRVDDGEVDLLIADQRMPLMEGCDLVAEARRRDPAVCCAILTAWPAETIATPGLRESIRAFISKPWDDEMLRRTIREILDGRREGWGMRAAE